MSAEAKVYCLPDTRDATDYPDFSPEYFQSVMKRMEIASQNGVPDETLVLLVGQFWQEFLIAQGQHLPGIEGGLGEEFKARTRVFMNTERTRLFETLREGEAKWWAETEPKQSRLLRAA